MSATFVFHDPSGRRWLRFQRAFGVIGVAVAILLVLFLLALISNPQLPALGLPTVERLANFSEVATITRGEKAAKAIPYKFHKPIKYVRNGGNPVLNPRLAAKPRADQPVVFGFYVNWDEASKVSLRLNLARLTHLVPEWIALKNGAGDIEDNSDAQVIQIARDAKLPILAEINNYREGWQAGDLHRVLSNPKSRTNLIDNIEHNLQEHKFAGVNIDFEQLPNADKARMVEFMRELSARLKPAGFLTTEDVPTDDDDSYDLKQLGEINDFIVPMVYDEHYQSGAPGPVASEAWYQDQLDRLLRQLPPSKTVVGVGNYGYDWIIGSKKGGVEVSYGDVIAAASANKAGIVWDKNVSNPVLRYKAGKNQHEVWFLDAVTALNHIQDAAAADYRGVAVWRLGGEDPGLWAALQHGWPEAGWNPFPLFKLSAQRSVQHYGEGEILRIADRPRDGARNVWREPSEDYAEQYQSLPSYYVVEHSGGTDKKQMSITFDDGPSEYTAPILDILKRKQVPATFFVIGQNAEQFPGALKREYAEGHTIGNHTYTHPNIAQESEESTTLELNTTLRLIEHDTGRSSILFRPPYNADSEPQTPAELLPIQRAQDRGYVTVGEKIDPRDWEINTTAARILEQVIEQKNDGHMILLHDGGGDRTPTLEALPQIIDTLRAEGYRFVPLEQLMDRTRDQLMPLPDTKERRWALLEGELLDLKGNFKKILGMLFLAAIYLTLFRSLVYGILALIQKRQAARRTFDPAYRPAVTVVIAAYNEEKVIRRTVQSILDNGYGDLEIVVVNDGSKDRTLGVLHEAFDAEPRVQILTQANAGKSAALNHAIRVAKNQILVAVDADTIFRSGAIQSLIRHFDNPKVGAVSGNARVGNRISLLTKFQSIEYICGFNLDRRALDLLNAITVVPGAVGAWRKDLILAAGGFGHDTLAEDTDLTLAIRRKGYRIRYEEQAIAFTEAPETTKDLAKQRFRWAFGTLQAAWKHRDATFNPRYGFLGLLALPSIWIFQVLLAALSPFAEVCMFIALFAGNWKIVLTYYFGLYLLELLTAALAYALEGNLTRGHWADLSLLFLQRIYYRQLMYFVLAKSILYAMRGRLVGWGKLERRATVTA